jgi:hypothetical protein
MRVVPNAAQNLEKMLEWIGISPGENSQIIGHLVVYQK